MGVVMRGKLITVVALSLCLPSLGPAQLVAGRQQPPVATFKSGVDLVRVTAVVRDRKGRFVKNLTANDFLVLDSGVARPITDFRHDLGGISVALLFDVSGSMHQRMQDARDAANHVVSWLEVDSDESAVFTFDTQLDEVTPFQTGRHTLPERLTMIKPFGATSLHDAIARTAERVAAREGRRRAVIVFTDGNDTWSRLRPSEVAELASAIDVPIYIIGVVPSIDNPLADNSLVADRSALAGPLSDLAAWTGGFAFVASTPADRSLTARAILDELRHQYLIAFESSGRPGWHPLEVRAKDTDLSIRARSGYIAGQSRPISH
jgi:VWFA-related protein